MKPQIISTTIGILFSLSGFIMDRIWETSLSPAENIFIGLFVYLISLTTFWNQKVEKIEFLDSISKNTEQLLVHFGISEKISQKHQNAVDSYWNLCVIKASNNIYTQKSPELIIIPHEERRLFWQQAILNTQLNWQCTNNVNLEKNSDNKFIV